MKQHATHERFIHAVRDIVARHVPDAATREKLLACKLLYGIGDGSYRGICYYSAWKNGEPAPVDCLEIAATGEESPVQLAGTTIHELAHTLARGDGHGKEWKNQCTFLGLRCALASGTRYTLAHLSPNIRAEIASLFTLGDGSPVFGVSRGTFTGLPPVAIRPCPMGQGARGGTSRGKGSGSRLRLYQCACEKPVKVRVASDEFKAHCDVCGESFKREETAQAKKQAA